MFVFSTISFSLCGCFLLTTREIPRILALIYFKLNQSILSSELFIEQIVI